MSQAVNKSEKISKLLKRIAFITIMVFFIGGISIGGYAVYSLTPKNPNSKELVAFSIEKGWGKSKVIDELEKQGIIKNAFVFKVYTRLANTKDFLAGTYQLSPNMDVESIIDMITSNHSLENEQISITFVEGKKFPYYAERLAEKFGSTQDEVIQKASDKEYLQTLINKYWFISDEILNSELYYPLEGYLFPDTYTFKKTSTIEEAIEKMLDEMGTKLEPMKEQIETSGKSIHSLLTMASMVELEAVSAEERSLVAGVFNNRLKVNMAMGSDVTTYYAARKEMTESLYMSEINACNAYNTRGNCAKVFPVGPICSASLSSITAAVTPRETEYMHFVADKNNKIYFSKTNDEQLAVIQDLRNKNLWPE